MLRDYPKMEGGGVKDYSKMAIRNLLHANSCVHSRRLIAEFPEDGIKCMEKLQSVIVYVEDALIRNIRHRTRSY